MANAYKNHWTPDEAIDKLYNKLFDGSNTGLLQTLVDTIELDENSNFWTEHFIVEGNEYDIDLSDTKKNPAWTVRQKNRRIVPMADPMAPLSETMQIEPEGWEEKTGSIYQYGKGLFDTSMSKLELMARLRELSPADRDVALGLQRGIADLIKSHNLRLSNMAAMTLSYGGAYSYTYTDANSNTVTTNGFSGVHPTQSAYIPLDNFKTAGTKVWSANDADIPEQMRKIENDFKEANSLDDGMAFEWDIPYNIVTTVLLKNAAFVAEVNRYIRLEAPDKVVVITSGASNLDTSVITLDQLVAYSRSSISKISPIRVVREQQTVQGITTYSTVKGWKPNTVVLRPLGMAGVVVHAKTADVKLMQSGEVNNNISWSLAKWNNLVYIINKVVPNGMLKSYHTDAIGRYATVLTESRYHVCVDIATADN
jgi:hypothetical protein